MEIKYTETRGTKPPTHIQICATVIDFGRKVQQFTPIQCRWHRDIPLNWRADIHWDEHGGGKKYTPGHTQQLKTRLFTIPKALLLICASHTNHTGHISIREVGMGYEQATVTYTDTTIFAGIIGSYHEQYSTS